ncbi:uncharacterized protein LOC106471033 [Limulus polyphemus]|uniref:Uncharacterized protein LOC106471033 n=1 Tax=Limulus polyphemus TaxID=6850 RepID=A0ABM1THK7_LIMPO|nr:uncharacterized protein LOC106471033 [Limulus polyphemus]
MNLQEHSTTPLSTKTTSSVEAVHTTPAVTPKFDPKLPLNLAALRQPKVGEIIMSLGGSPLQNISDVQNKKPGVTVSLGDGTVVNLSKEPTLNGVPNLSHSLKNELLIVQQKISQLIQLPKS